jgi:DNA polymerase-3 subunit alpha
VFELVNKRKTLSPSDYVHLHNHTQYSLLDGLTKVPALMEYVKAQGMKAVAITDHGTLSGLIEFYKEAKKNDIKPVLGIETYIASRSYTDKEATLDKPNYHLILLAINNTGYQNLMRLSTLANLDGFYYKPRIDHQLLKKYNQGIICLSGCMGSELGSALSQGLKSEAIKTAKWYHEIFKDRYFLEIQDHGHPDHPSFNSQQQLINNQLIEISDELGIPAVVTADAHYLTHADQTAHEILLCVQTNSFLDDPNRMSLKNFELHVTEPKEIIKRWGKDHPDFITNTKLIANQSVVDIPLGKILIPKFPVPDGQDEKSYLDLLVFQGLAKRYADAKPDEAEKFNLKQARNVLSKEILERTDYELRVIDKMGFNGYFLIVQDLIIWGKNKGVIFGPGRGSAAGSIISYGLRITEIDPLKYNLMFERFLNPSRVSMPDIDIDIQDTRRDEVIAYCIEKYGKDKVANIVTFGRMAARNAVRDVSRVLQVPYADADRLAKMIPPPIQGRHIPLKTSLKENKELKAEYKTNPTAKKVFDLAVQLEGTIRSHGVHAAGVVIAPQEIVNYTPLEMAQKGVIATQYSMGPIDELGLLKIDFLGLSNLTTINNCLRIIKKVLNKSIDILEIPNNDETTFDLLQRADTTGVFQLESAGMKRYLKELKPTLFADIIAMVSLYRPGPMSEIPRFIKGKNNKHSISYLHKSLEPILKETYGVMVYQEQIIQLLQMVAGYSAGEADLVRKAIGKKNRDIMTAEKPKFIEGCMKQGLTKEQADTLWAQIQPFADYSFNKAHATCYAQIAYWTAYLKAHYPQEFMAALLTSDYDDIDRLAIEISECTHMGITVLAPDINQSFIEFAVVPNENKIRFGLKAIKNVGSSAAEEILKAREAGKFLSLEDYLTRVSSKIVNRKGLDSLIKTGAFDSFADRQVLLNNLDLLLAFASKQQKQADSKQLDLFGNIIDNPETVVSNKLDLDKGAINNIDNQKDYLVWERELLGIYLSQHPLKEYEDILKFSTTSVVDISRFVDDQKVTLGGMIAEIREITTKNGQKMAFIKFEDLSGEIEMVVFPKTYQSLESKLKRDNILKIVGKVSSRSSAQGGDGSKSIIIEEAKELVNDPQNLAGPGAMAADKTNDDTVYIRLADANDGQLLIDLKRTIDKFKGAGKVIMVLGDKENRQAIKIPGGFDHSNPDAFNELSLVVGQDNIKLG